jgi:glycosyltransferase involved in cell wall biosynthesis
VLGLPHTQTNGEYATCAYTTRIIKFCRMMFGRERKVILYSGEYNTAPCDEHVAVLTEERRQSWFGPHELGDLERGGFSWDSSKPWWVEMNARAAGEIASRVEPTDLICVTAGLAQKLVADAHPANVVAEIMVGYEGILPTRRPSPAYCAFESHTHRHLVHGLNSNRSGREYDTVIPNQFDPDELPFSPQAEDYLLFVGRMIPAKGITEAAKVAAALDMRLIVAGPGAEEVGDGYIKFTEGGEAYAPKIEYVGAVGVEERARLMGGAAVLLAPTRYLEPFGGVAVEAMMCGTPVVTTNFGAFVETVEEGLTGYRFQTLQEAVDMTAAAMNLDRSAVRRRALERYSLEAVAPLYERWFANLDGLWGKGWDALREKPE